MTTSGSSTNGSIGNGLVEYSTGARFPGEIGRTTDESSPAWPEPLRADAGAPNVMFIVFDDTGYGQLGAYGGLADTPNVDRLAANGLTYTNMHTTALCSPSRSCILTGRNHHSNAMAGITEISTGYPGYNGNIPFENGFLSEMLREHGYTTLAVGKWHLTPAEQTSAAGPYDRWPLNRGFDRYYGFLGGDTHQYYPDLVFDNHQVDPPKTPEEGYHLTEDLADRAISFIGDAHVVAPDKPFFLYWAPGAMHAPHHAPPEFIERYRGKFDMGWDEAREIIFQRQLDRGLLPAGTRLSPRDPDVREWDSLAADEQRLYARMMEVFAGFLTHTDHQIGRILEYLDQIGELDNTLIMLISDNGASAEGGPNGSVNENKFFNGVPESLEDNLAAIDELGGPKHFNHYPWGWTWAGNAPFRRWKRETYRGGVSDPFIVHWPAGIEARGELRRQYAHVIDMVPTVLEALDVEPPEAVRGVTQSPIQGVSLKYSFDRAEAESQRSTQYFEMLGHRSVYHNGWRAVCPWPGTSFAESEPFGTPLPAERLRELDADGWELYHIDEDFAETENVATQHPELLQELISLWYVEAGKYDVLPIDGSATQRFAEPRPQLAVDRTRYVYFPDQQSVPRSAAVDVLNRAHSITADVEIPEGGAEGVLFSDGSSEGGYTFFVQGNRLHFVHNYVSVEEFEVVSDQPVPAGRVRLRFEFEPTGEADPLAGHGTPGHAQLYIDRELVGQSDFPTTIPQTIGITGGLNCGRDPGARVSTRYDAPFEFTGTIHSVTVDVSGKLIRDTEAQMREVMAHQ